MKVVIRRGVFETNSSSTHVLALVTKKDYEKEMAKGKSKYRKYGALVTKRDKMLMACGCCEEMYETSEHLTPCEQMKRFDAVKTALEKGFGCDEYFVYRNENLHYEIATAVIISVYCELTGMDYDTTLKEVIRGTKSGRPCHMEFFSEGALEDPEWDYRLIYRMFEDGIDHMRSSLRKYFDDGNVILYREYFGFIGDDDDFR